MTPATRHLMVLHGEVDAARDPELSRMVRDFGQSTATWAVVDLSDVAFMDSGGLRFIVRLRNIAVSRGGGVELVNPQPAVARVLRIVTFDKLCTIVSQAAAPPGAL